MLRDASRTFFSLSRNDWELVWSDTEQLAERGCHDGGEAKPQKACAISLIQGFVMQKALLPANTSINGEVVECFADPGPKRSAEES